jgi:hypothetical protein
LEEHFDVEARLLLGAIPKGGHHLRIRFVGVVGSAVLQRLTDLPDESVEPVIR